LLTCGTDEDDFPGKVAAPERGDEPAARVKLPSAQSVSGGGKEGVVIVVPGFAEGEWRESREIAGTVGSLAWLARARAVTTWRCARIHALGFGVPLMIVVVGIDQGAAARRGAVTAGGRPERASCSGEPHGAETPSSVARASSGGHDRRLAAG
jgi:hypothetical protein